MNENILWLQKELYLIAKDSLMTIDLILFKYLVKYLLVFLNLITENNTLFEGINLNYRKFFNRKWINSNAVTW